MSDRLGVAVTLFHVLTGDGSAGVHLSRLGTAVRVNLRAVDRDGEWMRFQYPLDAAEPGEIGIALFAYDASDMPADWEPREHRRVLPRAADGGLPPEVWVVPGTARVLTADPRAGGGGR